MCKPSCCPGERGSGLAAIVVIAAIIGLALIAEPAIHAAEVILRTVIEIAVIGAICLACTAIIAAIAILIRRRNRARPLSMRVTNNRGSQRTRRHLTVVPAPRAIMARNPATLGQVHQQQVLHHLESCPSCLQEIAPHFTSSHLNGGSDAW